MNSSVLVLALALDALLGEPKWLWSRITHPAVLMGNIIQWADKTFNSGRHKRTKGTLTLIALIGLAMAVGKLLSAFGWPLEVICAAILLAQRSLVDHVTAVARSLDISLEQGKSAVAMIVGRDTKDMDATAVARAAIESAAENHSDGVIAPAFWFLVAGLPGLLVYKITNTADSMIGYKTERHSEFGWASARFDDLLNLIPARLTALLIALGHHCTYQWSAIRKDAALHRSPNAGWPESAMARALDIALSGPRSYEGKQQHFPWVNEAARKTLDPKDIDAATRVLWFTWGIFTAIVIVLWVLGF